MQKLINLTKWTFSFFLIFFVTTNFAQTIPQSRISNWESAGYSSNLSSPAIILDVTQFGATGNGTTDDAAAIRLAIDSLHGKRGVVYFPPGNFLLNSGLDLPDSVIIRGATSDSTHLIFNFNGAVGNAINISGSQSGVFTSVISGAERNSSKIVVSDPSSFTEGDYAELIENNGSWDTQPVFWADNSVGQILHITKISSDTLFFDSPLRINYDSNLNVRVQKIIPATEVGIECLRISREDNVTSGVCINIFLNYAANCRIQGVESSLSIGSHIEADASTNITISGCYIHHSFLYDGVSTHGYGITLFAHSGQCLIENNILKHLRHSFSLQTGANGNVIAYNYSTDPNRSESPANASADISLHGHFPYSNLFESNIVQNIQIDQTHGPNGPFNTFFRNRVELYGIIISSGSVQNDSMNFVGNEVPNTGFLMGNYSLAGTGHFEFGNGIRGTLTPPGTSPLSDSSYYLHGPPSFWTSNTFPSVGIPNIIGSGSIPAKDRFISGVNLTSCNTYFNTGIELIDYPGFEIFPNPSSGEIKLYQQYPQNDFEIILKDFNGKNILRKKYLGSDSNQIINIPESSSGGIYLLEIISNGKRSFKKIVLIK